MLFFCENLYNDCFWKKSPKLGNFLKKSNIDFWFSIQRPPVYQKQFNFTTTYSRNTQIVQPKNNQNLKINFNGVKKLLEKITFCVTPECNSRTQPSPLRGPILPADLIFKILKKIVNNHETFYSHSFHLNPMVSF